MSCRVSIQPTGLTRRDGWLPHVRLHCSVSIAYAVIIMSFSVRWPATTVGVNVPPSPLRTRITDHLRLDDTLLSSVTIEYSQFMPLNPAVPGLRKSVHGRRLFAPRINFSSLRPTNHLTYSKVEAIFPRTCTPQLQKASPWVNNKRTPRLWSSWLIPGRDRPLSLSRSSPEHSDHGSDHSHHIVR